MNDFPFVAVRDIATCDTECALNYWLLKFRDIKTKVVTSFALYPGSPPLDVEAIYYHLARTTIITFNGQHYDLPMIAYALTGATYEQLKIANDKIIPGGGLPGLKSWEFYRYFDCGLPKWVDHIDLMEITPGVRISLKTYMGCINSRKMQDLPFDPQAILTPLDMLITAIYCENDLEGTEDLYHAVIERIKLREAINHKYNAAPQIGIKERWVSYDREYGYWEKEEYIKPPIDVRSKSDAQIAEALFKHLIPQKVEQRVIPHGQEFHYIAPSFIKFKSKQLQDILEMVQSQAFIISDKDQTHDDELDADGKPYKTGIIIPKTVKAARIRLGNSVYKFGIGGLHSQEHAVSHYSIPGKWAITDHDVASYYPSLILMLAMFPPQIGALFLEIYRAIYDERILAKDTAKKLKSRRDELRKMLNEIDKIEKR